MNTKRDVVIVGAGIVGLATALKLLRIRPGLNVTVLEKEAVVATHQTGHNSGVIHSGLYYKPGSEKARLCVAGRRELIEFCEAHDVAHRICGKLVIAMDDAEAVRLQQLCDRGVANGLAGLRIMGNAEAKELEPHVRCTAALHVPETGVVDYKAVTRAMVTDIESMGGRVITSAGLRSAKRRESRWHIETAAGTYEADFLITCAGLQADRVARMAGARVDARVIPFRGDYFGVTAKRADLVRTLIYPVPNPLFPFLGVHATRAIDGHVHVGPSASLAFARETYRRIAFNSGDAVSALSFPGLWRFLWRHRDMVADGVKLAASKRTFLGAVQRMIPEMEERDLEPAASGIRAQAMLPNGQLLGDFHYVDDAAAIHVLNAPSPAATASLAIGEAIARRALATGL